MSLAELQSATQKLSSQELHEFSTWVFQLEDAQKRQKFLVLPRSQKYARLQQAATEAAQDGLYAANSPLREWIDEFIDDAIVES